MKLAAIMCSASAAPFKAAGKAAPVERLTTGPAKTKPNTDTAMMVSKWDLRSHSVDRLA